MFVLPTARTLTSEEELVPERVPRVIDAEVPRATSAIAEHHLVLSGTEELSRPMDRVFSGDLRSGVDVVAG